MPGLPAVPRTLRVVASRQVMFGVRRPDSSAEEKAKVSDGRVPVGTETCCVQAWVGCEQKVSLKKQNT
jgi:hypothetical protein